jgi:hypothetical protein
LAPTTSSHRGGKLNLQPGTDFAEGSDRTKLLDGMIDHPGKSLIYSEVFMYGYGCDSKKLYFCGVPGYDEVKSHHKHESMIESYGDRLNFLYIVCHLPNSDGSALHLQPFSAMYKIAFIKSRFSVFTFPR